MNFLNHLEAYYSKEFIDKFKKSTEESRTKCFIYDCNKYTEDCFLDIPIIKQHPFIKNAFYYDVNFKLGNDYRFINGALYIQDAHANMSVELLDIKKDDIVLDMCASPGGKSIDALLKLNNTGFLISNELNYQRAKVLSSNIERFGYDNCFVTNNNFIDIYKNYPSTFDKVILDAPCSGSFMFRKNEEVEKDWTYNKVVKNSEIQENLLEAAAFMLKVEGNIAYSTCSISKEENELVIKRFLNKHPNFKTVEISHELFYKGIIPGSNYLLPFKFDGEGQFICILKKTYEDNDISINKTNKNKQFVKYNDSCIYKEFINKDYFCMRVKDNIYSFKLPNIDFKPLNILRYGLLISSINNKTEIPSFMLAHSLLFNKVISLTEEELKKYLDGETLNKTIKNGFYAVSYKKVRLGFVKSVNGILKNYYPKGLRQKLK